MSQENVEVVRKAWKAYGEQGIEGYVEHYAEDCVSEDFPELPDSAIYRGREGGLDRYRHFADAWGEFVIEAVDFIDAGGGVVVAVAEMSGSGPGSGTPMDAPAAFVYEVRDAKIVRDRAFTSNTQAREAAGLAE
jgi:ketosteroid isomerase-like protein